jgi:outer membrane protein TolC
MRRGELLRERLIVLSVSFALLLSLSVPLPALAETIELNIERALELAIANNNSIKIAESDLSIAQEMKRQARGSGGVTVGASHNSTYTDYQNGETYVQTYSESYSNAITASYPLYTGGVVGNTIKKAQSNYESQSEALRKSHQDIKQEVLRGIYAILQAEDSARQAEASTGRLAAHVDNVRIQYENGKVAKADLLRSEVELSNARQSYISALGGYDTAIKQLNSLMGVPLDSKLNIGEKMAYVKFPHTLEECLSYAREHHPELAMASYAVESAQADALIARGERLPQASVTATQNLVSPSSWPGSRADSFTIALDIKYTFIDSGVGASKVSQAEESVRRARHSYEQTLEKILLAVNSSYISITEAAQRVEESVSTIGKAQEAYDIAVNRYNEGVGTNIDVVDSQSALVSASSNHTQALCDYNIALAGIENSMGGIPRQ